MQVEAVVMKKRRKKKKKEKRGRLRMVSIFIVSLGCGWDGGRKGKQEKMKEKKRVYHRFISDGID